MVTNRPGDAGADPTRGTGPEKVTVTGEPGEGKEAPAADRGGCMNLGWGCLPVLAIAMIPASFLVG